MSLYKLESSDGKIFTVDAATVKQMVTIQTMIDHEDEDSDEVTPVPTVKAQVLEKIIQWTEYHKIDHEKTEKIAWYIQYFNVDLNELLEIIIGADYLEFEYLLKESCHNVLINNNWETLGNTASNFHDPKVLILLEKHEREYENEVIVTKVNNKKLIYFETKTRTLTHLTDIPEEHSRDYSKVCCVEGNIYLVGGDRGYVTEYNPYTDTWRNMPRLQKARERFGYSVCTLDNKIFVLGGGLGDTTCEMLDLNDDDPHWRYFAEMNRSHEHGGAVVVDRKIYVLGGGDDTKVEVYDVDQGTLSWFHKVLALISQTKQQDQWKIVTNMPNSRFGLGVAAVDNKIYITGGQNIDDDQIKFSVDCYDPDTNTWSEMANMNIARVGHSLVSLHGRLYAIGGSGVDSVEVYDPDNNTWTLLQHKLDGKVYHTGAGLIKKYYLQSA